MKILKPGKVEQRKFVCQGCECIFAVSKHETVPNLLSGCEYVYCPDCHKAQEWNNGEPYEEPTPTQTDRERLEEIVRSLDEYTAKEIAVILVEKGVTFGEGS